MSTSKSWSWSWTSAAPRGSIGSRVTPDGEADANGYGESLRDLYLVVGLRF